MYIYTIQCMQLSNDRSTAASTLRGGQTGSPGVAARRSSRKTLAMANPQVRRSTQPGTASSEIRIYVAIVESARAQSTAGLECLLNPGLLGITAPAPTPHTPFKKQEQLLVRVGSWTYVSNLRILD